MKKSIILTLLMAAFFVASANPVDVNTAKSIGTKFMQASTNVKSTTDLQLVATYSIDRGDAAFYVFNAENGYVIVAADDCAKPILAYSDEGVFDIDYIPIQFEEYLEGFVEQIQDAIENNISGGEKTQKQWELVKTIGRITKNRNQTAVGPLVTADWDQGKYYNRLCPDDAASTNDKHALVGCVATAMGQIMHCHKYPATGSGSHSYTPINQDTGAPSGYPVQTVNFGATTYGWVNMPDKLTSTSTETQINAVATLLWHCGVSVDMMYGKRASGAYSEDVVDALKTYFGYSNEISDGNRDDYDDAIWLARVKASLDLGRPLHYSGGRINDSGGRSGHAFVCDGYNDQDFLHFNWGWSGSCNTYCAVNALDANGRKYVYGNYAIFNIHPSTDGTTNHTVTASANNSDYGTATGSGSFADGTVITVTASPKTGYVFMYWSENGVTVSTESSYSFKVQYRHNLTAVFAEPNSITINALALNNTGGTVSGSGNCNYGDTRTVTATPSEGYTFLYWLDNNEIVSTSASYEFTVIGNRNLEARFELSSSVCPIDYYLVDTYGDGWSGNKLNVTYDGKYSETLELSQGVSATFRRNAIDGERINFSWTLGYYIQECQFSLKHAAGDIFYTKTNITASFTDEFYLDCNAGSDYTFNGTNSDLWSLATNWESGNKPTTTAIVGIEHDVTVDENVTVGTLNIFEDKTVTINSGITLTVTGTIAQMAGSNIVIEDGGQLVNQTQGITGTVKKAVNAYEESVDGWYAVSTPVNDVEFANVNHLTDEDYDVFRYNETTATWENCRNPEHPFNSFESGRGYLYRRADESTLEFNGTLTTSYVRYSLSYTAASGDLKGFHLVGNPYTHNIYKGANTAFYNYSYLEDGFYTLQTNGVWLAGADNSTPINPCEAILVKAKSFVTQDDWLYFVNSTASGASKDVGNVIQFAVSNDNFEDVAYAIFKDGDGLNKIEHRNKDAQMLYIHNNDADYAVADIDDETKEFDLYFKAATIGKYNLKVNVDSDFNYLHLIDMLTGEDIDLLAETQYSFVGSPSDPVERFVVTMANPNSLESSENPTFAYQNGDEIIITCEGLLQIYDIMGRMISTNNVVKGETIHKPAPTGVYILQLLGNDVKTQKIIIK